MSTEQMARWRLILGSETENSFSAMGGSPLSQEDFLMDNALAAIYGQSGDSQFGSGGGKGAVHEEVLLRECAAAHSCKGVFRFSAENKPPACHLLR